MFGDVKRCKVMQQGRRWQSFIALGIKLYMSPSLKNLRPINLRPSVYLMAC